MATRSVTANSSAEAPWDLQRLRHVQDIIPAANYELAGELTIIFNVTEYAVHFINLFLLHHAAYTLNDETQTFPYPSRATLSGWLRSLQYTAVTITSCSGFRHFVEIITKAVQAVAPTYLQSVRLQFTVSFFKEVIGARQAASRGLTTAAKYKLFVADVEGLVALPMRVEVLSLTYTDDHRSNSEGILLPSFNVWSPNGVRIYAISNTVALRPVPMFAKEDEFTLTLEWDRLEDFAIEELDDVKANCRAPHDEGLVDAINEAASQPQTLREMVIFNNVHHDARVASSTGQAENVFTRSNNTVPHSCASVYSGVKHIFNPAILTADELSV
ncbi:uncharacterized protein EHS24_000880 [Apiotrichum porosum]|uniref:Uncharacterized protein n=1 Tax=Apiotrichum porosum TaxID=105984 RepID=A0A427YB61_9TREE|nr:uncharacterized protein EHS24_000880 [Apiotrichum porosum]RSH88342.1 hypothetical protein EHS24_000880 [Apiotrichum porosum]